MDSLHNTHNKSWFNWNYNSNNFQYLEGLVLNSMIMDWNTLVAWYLKVNLVGSHYINLKVSYIDVLDTMLYEQEQ